MNNTTTEKVLRFENMERVVNVFGSFDSNIKIIQEEYNVRIMHREDHIKIFGNENDTSKAAKVLDSLYHMVENGEEINEQKVRYVITLLKEDKLNKEQLISKDCVCLTALGKPITAKTLGQKKYVEAINDNTVVFGIGPAGTGKTYLAVAKAVSAFRKKEISRIILTRPAVEAGEKLGFLPGDLQNKVDPYLRPLYDALYEMMGAENYQKYLEKNMIEVAPLAYMRGRTLDNSFIILDEAQNTTPEQMKMFLTRLGFGSKVVVTGDITQIDLPRGKNSGLKESVKILKNVDGIEFINLTYKDVVRHPLVQKIVNAYERYSENDNRREKKSNYFKKKQ